MPQSVKMPNGDIAKFPDNMPQEQIENVINSHLNSNSSPQEKINPIQNSQNNNAPYGTGFSGQSMSGLVDFLRSGANSALVNPINYLAGRQILNPYPMELKGSAGQKASSLLGDISGTLIGPGKIFKTIEAANIPRIGKNLLNIGAASGIGAAESPDNRNIGALIGGATGGIAELANPILSKLSASLAEKTPGHLLDRAKDLISKSYGEEKYNKGFESAKQKASEYEKLTPMAKSLDINHDFSSENYQSKIDELLKEYKPKENNPAYKKVLDSLESLGSRPPKSYEEALNTHEEINQLPGSWGETNKTATKLLKRVSGQLNNTLKNEISLNASKNPQTEMFNKFLNEKLKDYGRYQFLKSSTEQGYFNAPKALTKYQKLSDYQRNNLFSPDEKKLFDTALNAKSIGDKEKWFKKLNSEFSGLSHVGGYLGKLGIGALIGHEIGHPLMGLGIPLGIDAASYGTAKLLSKNPELVKKLIQFSEKKNYPQIKSKIRASTYPIYSNIQNSQNSENR